MKPVVKPGINPVRRHFDYLNGWNVFDLNSLLAATGLPPVKVSTAPYPDSREREDQYFKGQAILPYLEKVYGRAIYNEWKGTWTTITL